MAEWLYEAGIGESRAALVEHGTILAARIERDDGAPRVGAVLPARLVEITVKGREGRVAFDDGEATLTPLPPGITQGSVLTIGIVRAELPEPGRVKLARCMAVAPLPSMQREETRLAMMGPDLLARIAATGHPVRHLHPHQPDALEAAGWSEVLDEALTGDIAFPGGMLLMSPTSAMTLFDVDGAGPLEPLAIAAATAVGQALRRHGIGGSIGIDFPTLAGKAPRQAVAAALDAALALDEEGGPFERTAVNGFGFLQIVRRRTRASLPELLRADPVGAEVCALLRSLEHTPPPLPRHHRVSPRVLAALEAHPAWTDDLARRTGTQPIFEGR